jgi:hypothetical protein
MLTSSRHSTTPGNAARLRPASPSVIAFVVVAINHSVAIYRKPPLFPLHHDSCPTTRNLDFRASSRDIFTVTLITMRCHTLRATAAILLASGLVAGQTPSGTNPATSHHLNVQYNSTQLMADELLLQSCMYTLRPSPYDELTSSIVVATQPTVSLNETLSGTHLVMLVDLSIPPTSFNGTGPRAPGLEPCRTTRLHWFQGNLTQLSNGTFMGDSAAIADYGEPSTSLMQVYDVQTTSS